jgi:glutathione synthase
MGIFRVRDDGLNLGAIIETLNRDGPVKPSWCKSLCPLFPKGDKRVLVIGGKPVPYCLARIPQGGEVRGNLAAGGQRCGPTAQRAQTFEIAEAYRPRAGGARPVAGGSGCDWQRA